MKKKNFFGKCLKIFLFVLVVVILFNSTSVYAWINEEYKSDTSTIDITDETIKNNLILDYVGQFIFALGNIFQSLISWIFGILTGKSAFPWADMVIFNTIPILDVNFINPYATSFFSETEGVGIGAVIRSVYYTGLSISLGFLGIIIGVMAIRLALSSIGEEKAKYKEAISKWATSIVLLFSMHYVLSFLFYLNEELVVVASKILKDNVEESGQEIAEILNANLDENMEKVVNNYIAAVGEDEIGSEYASILRDNYKVAYTLINNETYREKYLNLSEGSDTMGFTDSIATFVDKQMKGLNNVGNSLGKIAGKEPKTYTTLGGQQGALLARATKMIAQEIEYYNMCQSGGDLIALSMEPYYEISHEDLVWQVQNYVGGDYFEAHEQEILHLDEEGDGFGVEEMIEIMKNNGEVVPDYNSYTDQQLLDLLREYEEKMGRAVLSNTLEDYEKVQSDTIASYGSDSIGAIAMQYCLKALRGELDLEGENAKNNNLISNLGEYFKRTAWSVGVDNGGWAPTQISIISAILYTIFVFQSAGFFVSYVKRLFLVVALAVLAPIVVIYDFFMKSALNSGNNIFSTWLKELCSLIFVQTFHAFLFAIIMSIIVKAVSNQYLTTISGGIEAAGLLAVFALLSLPKLELLVKNIFGLTSSVADTSLAAGQRSSFAGGYLALKAGKKLLDNPRKIAGGLGRALIGQANLRKARNARNDQAAENETKDDEEEKKPAVKKTIKGYSGGSGTLTGLSKNMATAELTSAIKRLTTEVSKQNANANKQNKKSDLKELEKAIEDAKKERYEGLKTMFTGTAETVGALHGAVAGAVIGAGTNNNIGDYALKGAGAGDVIANTTINVVSSTYETGKKIAPGIQAGIKANTPEVKQAYKRIEKDLKNKKMEQVNEYKKMIQKYNQKSGTKKKSNVDDI